MKKTLLYFLLLAGAISAKAQIVNIPDPNFKEVILNSGINTNQDNEIQVSEAEAATGTMDISNKDINDLTGIEAFVNISTLNCSHNNLSSLDISNLSQLEELLCSGNNLITLDITQNTSLAHIEAANNELTQIIIGQNNQLENLGLIYNNLSQLNVSNLTGLEELKCSYNQLTSLDLSQNLNIYYLDCSENLLNSLDFSQNGLLQSLACYNNELIDLDLRNGTNELEVYAFNNPDLDCILVDDKNFCENSPNWDIDDTAHYAESEEACTWAVEGFNEANIKVYPNPVKNQLYLQGNTFFQGNFKLTLFSLQGKKIQQRKISTQVQPIDLSPLDAGVYFLQIVNNKTSLTKKIIKQ